MQLVVGGADVHCSPPFPGVVESAAVTVYTVIALPPSDGAVHETGEDWMPTDAVTPEGGSGTVDGVTALDAADDPLVPIPLVAVTVNV